MSPLEITAEVSGRLERLGIRHLVGGSFASSAWGEIRATNDVDIAVLLAEDRAHDLTAAFAPPYHISHEGILRALAEPGPYRMAHARHTEESFSIDLFLVRPDEYTLTELDRARRVVIADIGVPFSAPENIVIQKLRWYEEGRRVSDRQWNDIVRVLDNQRKTLDYAYLSRWAETFGLGDLLRQAFDDRESDDPYA